jgi:hypothetical protein
MAKDPYRDSSGPQPSVVRKVPVRARLVAVMQGQFPDRGLELIVQRTRAVSAGEVHELIVSDEAGITAGSVVNRISYLGFVEMLNAGVLVTGDEVRVGDTVVGHLAGFDYTHMPNHMNIVISVARAFSGQEAGLEPGQSATFVAADRAAVPGAPQAAA